MLIPLDLPCFALPLTHATLKHRHTSYVHMCGLMLSHYSTPSLVVETRHVNTQLQDGRMLLWKVPC